jgi:hypothetical protein
MKQTQFTNSRYFLCILHVQDIIDLTKYRADGQLLGARDDIPGLLFLFFIQPTNHGRRLLIRVGKTFILVWRRLVGGGVVFRRRL